MRQRNIMVSPATNVPAVLVDFTNISHLKGVLKEKLSTAKTVGFDIETHDQDAHDGLKAYRGKSPSPFDYRRTTVTGFSLYVDGDGLSYYLNLAHADIENRVPWADAKEILDAIPPECVVVCHNAPYELTNMQVSLGYTIPGQVVCTLQMAVSAYGPDQYPIEKFDQDDLKWIAPLAQQISQRFASYQQGTALDSDQEDLLFKVIGKSSTASFSYNGLTQSLAYGYGLKKLVKSFFNFDMITFEQVTGGRHMGQLTGAEVAGYGADDAFWAVKVFHRLLLFMAETNPQVIDTFFQQENPMIHVFSEIAQGGMRVNPEAVEKKRESERAAFAQELRNLKAIVRKLLPFDAAPSESLMKYEDWYVKNHAKYRKLISDWAAMPDTDDDFAQCYQVRSPVGNAWATELGMKESKGMTIGHYMPMRVMIYDLLRERAMVMAGKVQSDGENRGRLMDRLNKNGARPEAKQLLETITRMASIETTMKLFLTPYTMLVDPDTGYMYPVVTSMLATRRMAASDPNTMQMTKRGPSVYVRGFFSGDKDPQDGTDHVIVSLDWSQIELVIIGDQSGDPEFAKAYGQLPYNDLHLGAAADILSALYDVPVTEEMFKSLKSMDDDVVEPFGFPLVDATGTPLTPQKAYAYNRGTAGGKGANFGYWYSGSLASVATARGVGSDLMWKMTDAYRSRFPVAENWRLGTIETAARDGRVILPDGHAYYKYEATLEWQIKFINKFDMTGDAGLGWFARIASDKIKKRAGRQSVNALVQGTCATLAKRSIIRMRERNPGLRWRFLTPIHDEVVFSVHVEDVIPFIVFAKSIMLDHPDIIRTLKMHCTAAVGRSFEPWHAEKAPYGQIELDELPKLDFIDEARWGKAANENELAKILEYLAA